MRYKKTFSIYLLIIFVLLQGISGLLGGISLIIDPSGGQIGLPVNWLEGSPFENFLIPGIILLTVLGVFPLVTTMGLISGTRKALISSRLIGYALLIWIGVEIIIIGYRPDPPLQLIFGIEGVIILLLAYSTVVTNYYT
jgi:hypothetical protein